MAETVFSAVEFRATGLAVGVRGDGNDRFNHVPGLVRGEDSALQKQDGPVASAVVSGRPDGSGFRVQIASCPHITPVGGKSKRILDIVAAATALILLAPFLLLVAAAVKLSMGGPVLYRHRRIGFNGVPFDCLKFRTMVAFSDAAFRDYLDKNPSAADEWRRKRKLENDPRVTRIGRLLRKTSLDELPQFINVLRGEMSLVGPRPVVMQELELYGNSVGYYMRARPGVTGLWQISGRSSLSFDQRIELDSAYVRNWALGKDVQIIVQTVPALFRTLHAV